MPRKPRFFIPDVPVHVVQRGNDRQATFFADDDLVAYLNWLQEGASQHGCAVHAYVLMSNHVHLLMTPESEVSISRTMQFIGRHYVSYVNRRYQRTGTLWEGRFKASLIDSAAYALACARYIELNPVRAGIVTGPGDYRWSSYAWNAFGMGDMWLKSLPEYHALGNTAMQRQLRYRELFNGSLRPELVHDIRCCVQTGTPLGDEGFRQQVERTVGQQVGQARRGRPRHTTGNEDRRQKGTDPFSKDRRQKGY